MFDEVQARTTVGWWRGRGGGAEGGALNASVRAQVTSDPQPDPLPCLIADAEPAVLGRTVLAVAAMHEPDDQGKCRVCAPRRSWWRWWSRDGGGACPTRRVLWSTLVGESGVAWSAYRLDARANE